MPPSEGSPLAFVLPPISGKLFGSFATLVSSYGLFFSASRCALIFATSKSVSVGPEGIFNSSSGMLLGVADTTG